jgi:hypothetical protein
LITPDLNYDGFARRRLYLSYLACLLYDGTGYFRSTFDRAHYPHCVTDRPTEQQQRGKAEERTDGRKGKEGLTPGGRSKDGGSEAAAATAATFTPAACR